MNLTVAEATIRRCSWVPEKDEVYRRYHDEEWGVPIRNDALLYEMFLLETFQAGLSWRLLLAKREAFREAFDGFDPEQIARYGSVKVEELTANPAIVRNRRKIEAAVQNAGVVLAIQKEQGSFSDYLWRYVGGVPVIHAGGPIPKTTEVSDRMSKDLIRRGMRFVGSVTLYSFLEAVGIMNNHETDCFRHDTCGKEEKNGPTNR